MSAAFGTTEYVSLAIVSEDNGTDKPPVFLRRCVPLALAKGPRRELVQSTTLHLGAIPRNHVYSRDLALPHRSHHVGAIRRMPDADGSARSEPPEITRRIPNMTFGRPVTELIESRYSCRSYQRVPLPDAARGDVDSFLQGLPLGPFGTPLRLIVLAGTESGA